MLFQARKPRLGRVASLLCGVLGVVSPGRAEDVALSAQAGADTHSVVQGDTLWGLSDRYYKSPYEWPRLWSYNPEITNPHWIYPGHVLKLSAPGQSNVGAGLANGGIGGPQLFRRIGGAPAGQKWATATVQIGEQAFLDADALKRSASIVGSPEDHMMLFPSDELYLSFAKDAEAPHAGQELTIFVRYHRDEVRPRANKLPTYNHSGGEVVRVVGAIKVLSYDDRRAIAKGVITEAMDPIERGFEVADIPRRLAQVPPKTNARGVKAQIVAAPRPLGTLGQNQLVFIGAGENQGVEIGNRFAVVRQGDSWRDGLTLKEHLTGAERPGKNPPKGADYPEEVVAEARVIYVRPESCTALITEALLELTPGDRVEMREGY